MTAKDEVDLRAGLGMGADFVGVSFVRRASDLAAARASGLPVIAKIETAAAAEHLEEIVGAADGIMVARGDLGVEIPIERVPRLQKRLIALANQAAKPVITATQMLRSMVESLVPTRAEATDVANAVLDGTDAVMLSEETAIGQHPAAAVAMMRRILCATEPSLAERPPGVESDPAAVIAEAACDLARRVAAGAIVVPTQTGATARRVAARRPRVPIVALTPRRGRAPASVAGLGRDRAHRAVARARHRHAARTLPRPAARDGPRRHRRAGRAHGGVAGGGHDQPRSPDDTLVGEPDHFWQVSWFREEL